MFVLPVRDVAQVALRVRVRHPGVAHPRDRQLVCRSRQAAIAAPTFRQRRRRTGRHLLLGEAGGGGAARRGFLLRGAESEKTGKKCIYL